MISHLLKVLLLASLSFSLNAADPATVSSMLEQFQAKGILNQEQAKEAQTKLNQITPEQWAKIRKQAEHMKAEGRVPAQETQNSVDAAAGLIDTNSPVFQKTMSDMKKILEE
ncbi:MAG: hypothetical protein K9K67_03500 [Bacteriovoracaceae bacterium]|nr:hypothetical protein [Bacteriovoracaceae bacterium]